MGQGTGVSNRINKQPPFQGVALGCSALPVGKPEDINIILAC